ncbi:TetR/AcrR family transcriptional regulator [Acidithiobacillus sp.]
MIPESVKKTRNPEQTRADLLAAAYGEVLECGFQAASLERILAKTSVSKGALYHHFGTKHELGLAVVDEVIGPQLAERWFEPLRRDGDPIAALTGILEEKIRSASEAVIRFGCPLNNLIQEMSPLDERFRSGLQNIPRRLDQGHGRCPGGGATGRQGARRHSPAGSRPFYRSGHRRLRGFGQKRPIRRCLSALPTAITTLCAIPGCLIIASSMAPRPRKPF